ncbi:dynamin family protein [uncultured Clostridium sp.]|uniref:dynamin family protein n=1 Tax=uncultured Clostridium sp. TaxID=59620 RepID=UPI0025F05C9B|nr:dynamin family protein [uncultured Clostridium sp.]
MLEDFNIKKEEVFPICVMATMSSGKSTFINSILGTEILPEKNEACTARALSVINNDKAGIPRAYIVKNDGTKGYVEIDSRMVMEKVNSDENVKNVLIEMNIPSILNITKPLVLIDTPGVNNSDDMRHAERTKAILDEMDRGVIIYILNATQLATNDDALLLQMVAEHVKKHPSLNICFVLNKIDMLDEDKESIEGTVETAQKYISDYGLDKPLIYPLSALSAKILRLKLNDKYMTKTEQRYLIEAYKEYEPKENNMIQYSGVYKQNLYFQIDDKEVSEYELRRAIENTGICGIENQITKYLIGSEKEIIEQFVNTSVYEDFEGVYSRRRKSKNMKNYTGKVKWICKACRQVNGDNEYCLNCNKRNLIWRKIL